MYFGHTSSFFFYFTQVIYSSSPISWPSFKPLAQTLFEISCWQDFILIFSKGHNSRKGDNWQEKKYRSAIFPWQIHIRNFKTLACTVHKIWHASEFILIFSMGHNSRKRDNLDKKKKHVSAIFPWGIYIWNFKTLVCMVLDKQTDTQTHAQPETNTPSTSSKWGHKNYWVGGKMMSRSVNSKLKYF